ncbi:hypothetical protein [Vibrio harveyi]|uniref:hypothetical protein n=1 Tax=Vibrio harveyi TaxID=669 RepID=UPI00155855C4|nr:hypothetical protein [Vibrio harveyi]
MSKRLTALLVGASLVFAVFWFGVILVCVHDFNSKDIDCNTYPQHEKCLTRKADVNKSE